MTESLTGAPISDAEFFQCYISKLKALAVLAPKPIFA